MNMFKKQMHKNRFLMGFLMLLSGCIKSDSLQEDVAPFETKGLDRALVIVIDMSGSFVQHWETKAYPMFIDLADQFFTEGIGMDTRLVICQLSNSEQVVLFEGSPQAFRKEFQSSAKFSTFLKSNSDASGSRVYHATNRALNYVNHMSGVDDETKLLTVFLSDMIDSNTDFTTREKAKAEVISSMQEYNKRGGAIALYYVDHNQVPTWQSITHDADFPAGYSLIESDLSASPQLPKFE